MFSNQEFEVVCRELINGNNDPEYQMILRGDIQGQEFSAYRKFVERSGLYQYKTFSWLDGIDPETCAKMYQDPEYRWKWDPMVTEIGPLREGPKKGYYRQIDFNNCCVSRRDFTYINEDRELDHYGKKVYVILQRSEIFNSHPKRPGVIRVEDNWLSLALTSDGKTGTKVFSHFYFDLKGSFPKCLLNASFASTFPRTHHLLQAACTEYPAYLASLQTAPTDPKAPAYSKVV